MKPIMIVLYVVQRDGIAKASFAIMWLEKVYTIKDLEYLTTTRRLKQCMMIYYLILLFENMLIFREKF